MKDRTLFAHVNNFIKKHGLIISDSTIIVGLSGGPDSVCLLHILNKCKEELKLSLIAAHVDHGWRAESEKEAQFCRELCREWGVPLVVQKLSEISARVKFNGSREEYARKMRRHFFEQLAREHGAGAIALGHHADDQVETFFIRLVRGASSTGLAGMRAQHGWYIRPLLACTKDEIRAYLEMQGLSYVTDPSNSSDEYLRNRIRTQLVPLLDAIDIRARKNIAHSMNQLQATEAYLTQQTHELWQKIAYKQGESWCVDAAALYAQPVSMRHRLMMHWLILEQVSCTPTQDFFAEIERFISRPGSKTHRIHAEWSICKRKNVLSIVKNLTG